MQTCAQLLFKDTQIKQLDNPHKLESEATTTT
jgi:hypothetical protein